MGAEENYLDKLLKSVTEPGKAKETEAEEMSLVEETEEELVLTTGESVSDEAETEATSVAAMQISNEESADESVDSFSIDDLDNTAEQEITNEPQTVQSDSQMMDDELSIDDIDAEPLDELSIDDIDTESLDELSIDDIDTASFDELTIDDIDAILLDEEDVKDVDTTMSDEGIIADMGTDILAEIDKEEAETEAPEETVFEEIAPVISEEVVPEETVLEVSEETALSEETLQIAEEVTLEEELPEASETEETDELRLGELDLEGMGNDDLSGVREEDTLGADDELEDVLSMLDDDADLAEINDILKKSDSKEPIQDEMMDLLNQMADDEAELVNAGVKDIVEDDGVPLPEMPVVKNKDAAEEETDSEESAKGKKKNKEEKAPGAVGKFFNLLTEDLPGPTEADYAAEDEAKAAKKQEEKEKKEQEKLAKDEEKKAKAEEKAAAKKAKADAAAAKKKEKEAAKAEKAAAKKAKQQAEAIKRAKRIPPKKIVAVAVFGVSVFGAVMVSTTILSNQGYINIARRAFYDGDYKSVYLSTYGMELNDSDAMIQARSEVILKMQCWYDSYQNNLKLNREREALDALLHGIEAYDNINAEAEQYNVLSEVDGIKNTILNELGTKYGLSEDQAKDLLRYEDALAYTMALNDIITKQ